MICSITRIDPYIGQAANACLISARFWPFSVGFGQYPLPQLKCLCGPVAFSL